MSTVDRAVLLVGRCMDGLASAADVAELDRILSSGDAKTASAVVGAIRMESMLEETVRAHLDLVGTPPAPAHDMRRAATRLGWSGVAAAVGAAAVVLIAWISLSGRKDPEIAINKPPAVAPAVPAVPQQLQLEDGSTVLFQDAQTDVAVHTMTAALIQIDLSTGKARFEVVARPGRRFRVRAGEVYVTVVGTSFSVERYGEMVGVEVHRGVVEVVGPSDQHRLTAGQSAVINGTEKRPARAIKLHRAPVSRVPGRRSVSDEAPVVSQGVQDPAGDLLKRSNRARMAGQLEEAAAVLRTVMNDHERDPRAAYAAFALGRVLLDELGRPSEAADAFARVPELDPRTPLAPDALAKEIEASALAGDLDRARRRAGDYLSRYPDGPLAAPIRARWHAK